MKNRKDHLSFTVLQDLLSKWNPNRVTFSGGEPFLHPKIKQIIATAINGNVQEINIITNGTQISKNKVFLSELKELANSYQKEIKISFSLDGKTKQEIPNLISVFEFGIKTQVYIYPMIKQYEVIREFICKVSAYIESCQLLFPIPFGKNSLTMVAGRQWEDTVKYFREICAPYKFRFNFQAGYSNFFNPDDKSLLNAEESIFIDCDGSEHECCLLAEVKSLGYQLPYDCCRVNEGYGCLALLAVHKKDFRLKDDPSAPCPLQLSNL